MGQKIIKILVVEDSPVALMILKRIFATSPDIEVIATAHTGLEALELIPQIQPDVICTDLVMPGMNGLDFTREVMMKFPRPILVISASVQADDTSNVFQLLEAGAVDVFPKPTSGLASDYERLQQDLIGKIRVLSGVKVFTRHQRKLPATPNSSLINSHSSIRAAPSVQNFEKMPDASLFTSFRKPPAPFPVIFKSPVSPRTPKVIAIGASTGGPHALHTILAQLPKNLPVPVICVQHISEGFLQGLVNWLAAECQLPVKIAQVGEVPQSGHIYFPPERHHLELDNLGRFVCSTAPAVGGHRPSVTVTFQSVAHFYGASALGVLLTGMGRDGADGMLAIAQAGGLTIAQDEVSCVVFGMPKEAIALGAAQYVLPINAIAATVLKKIQPLG